jgi:putative tryptophan/tyrosine transport system substrate-binding protein
MNRRKFLILSTTVGLLPVAARSQGHRRTIGVLMAGNEGSPENVPRIAAFRKALTELGWRDGDNVDITTRWSAGKNELVQQYAKELVERAPDVILANSTTVISALKTKTSPFRSCLRWRWTRSGSARSRAWLIPAATSPASRSSTPS